MPSKSHAPIPLNTQRLLCSWTLKLTSSAWLELSRRLSMSAVSSVSIVAMALFFCSQSPRTRSVSVPSHSCRQVCCQHVIRQITSFAVWRQAPQRPFSSWHLKRLWKLSSSTTSSLKTLSIVTCSTVSRPLLETKVSVACTRALFPPFWGNPPTRV